ncbi:hypothetical protein [Okeania sp.]|uniref:hypothetical protein n=1 Tax=Okeania sp. TaxID=3100323 RepID=UPI002B4B3D05|nr:hypothetical protein [Okeania sp.]MEB3342112.1 hypothetical protein [Okeania sp.]
MSHQNFPNFFSSKFSLSTPKKYLKKRWIFLTAIQLLSSSFLMVIPEPATGIDFQKLFKKEPADIKSFRLCSENLLSVGLSNQEVANACSATVEPEDLSICVTKIYNSTTQKLPAQDILLNCQQVRRVDELGTCVENINLSMANISNQFAVLEGCRRSLLPEDFSACVVGLSINVKLPTEELLNTCLNPDR